MLPLTNRIVRRAKLLSSLLGALLLSTSLSNVVAAPTTPTPSASPQPSRIALWWPASLSPSNGSVQALLQKQLDDYQQTKGQSVELRIKRDIGSGSILETLRNGSIVAPAAMPDLALMRRADLLQAISAKLVEPIDLSALGVDDIFTSAADLGRVNGILYGVPYALELQHTIYKPSTLDTAPLTLEDVQHSGIAFVFPAGALKGVNTTFLAQYIAAGGRVSDAKGAPVIDADPLKRVLQFYEQGATSKQVTPTLLDYTNPAQYITGGTSTKSALMQIDSTLYLSQRTLSGSVVAVMAFSPLPTASATPVSVVDGWMWVLTTVNPDRQAKALDLLSWMIKSDAEGAFLQSLNILPARRSALATWHNDPYVGFVRPLLEQSPIPYPDAIDPTVASALQKAFGDVLSGRKSADAATTDALSQVTAQP